MIDIVQYAHDTLHIAHRDIKPHNIFLSSNDESTNHLILSDWGSAATLNETVHFEGTYGFYDIPLYNPMHIPTIENDLKALVKICLLYVVQSNAS